MSNIAHIAGLWSLEDHPSPKRQWSLDRKMRAVAEAGFSGITTSLKPEHRPLAEKHGLEHLLGFISSSEPDRFGELVRIQKDNGAVHINMQMDDDDTPPAVAVKHWLKLEREAEKIGGVVVSLEMHRDTCTETPEKTYEIAERYHKATGRLIKLNFDFSHFAVVKHLGPGNYIERMLDHPELVQNSDQCHFRPFNGHHCQVPVTWRGALTPEVKSYLKFVTALMKLWKKAPKNAKRTMYACPEMGPMWPGGAGYNITGLPSAWKDAVVLRSELAKAWNRA